MEPKKQANYYLYESLVDEVAKLANEEYEGNKSAVVSAAAIMFLNAPEAVRNQAMRLVAFAEVWGKDKSLLDAIREIEASELGSSLERLGGVAMPRKRRPKRPKTE